MKLIKVFFKQLFCRHDYGKFNYSHDNRFAFSSCKKCGHHMLLDNESGRI